MDTKMNFAVTAFLTMGIYLPTYAQVGINNQTPRATLDIIAAVPAGTGTPQVKDGVIVPNIDRARAQAMGNNTGPITATSTLIYIDNPTTGTATGSTANVTVPGYYYFDTAALPAPGLWQPLRPSNLDVYGAQLRIPPHNQFVGDFSNHSNTNYDNDNWWVISKSSTSGASNAPARMTIVYEFQGTPFNINNLYPQLTAANNTGLPDIYTTNVSSIANSGTGNKTRLTVTVVRSDSFGTAGNWQGTFLLNTLLARKIN